MRYQLLALLLVPALGVLACRGTSGGVVAGRPEALTYDKSLKVDLPRMTKSPTGLYTQDLVTGTGAEAVSGSTVDVHYTGWLANGKEFDSSRGKAPFSFTIDQGMVIPGWDQGVTGMKAGGKRRLVIPPELGYGDAGAGGVIPPGATLVFDVELLGVR